MPFNDRGQSFHKCPQCKNRRAIECFNKAGKGLRRSQCRECEHANRYKHIDLHGESSSTRHNRRRRFRILQHYSGKESPECECCGENSYEFLSIDHIEGDGAAHRREIGVARIYAWLHKNNYPPGFRVLCHNCNQALGAYGFCPHNHPELSLTAPPPNMVYKKQAAADQELRVAATRLVSRGIPITAKAVAGATGATLTSVEKRMARLRKDNVWPFPRVKKNKDKF